MNENTPPSSGESLPPGARPARNGGYLIPFKPGQSGNPKGRPAIGLTLTELINHFGAQRPTEAEMQAIADDPKRDLLERHAALHLLQLIGKGAMEQYERLMNYTVGRPKQTVEKIQTEAPVVATFEKLCAIFLKKNTPLEYWPTPARAWYERTQIVKQGTESPGPKKTES